MKAAPQLGTAPRLISVAEAARLVGCHKSTYLLDVARGYWPAPFRIGGKRKVDRVVLEERIDQLSGREPATAPDQEAEIIERVTHGL